MAVYKSRGIVLRSIRYGEADRILDLYTPDAGLVSGIAKGIRRTRSRFGGRLEPLSCVEFLAYRGRSLDTITQAEVLRSFHGVREDLGRLEVAGGLARDVRMLSGGDEPDRRVFNLLYHGLDALEEHGPGLEAVEPAFGLKLSILAGYAPQLDACAVCGVPALDDTGEPLGFAPDLGGMLCAGCREEDIPAAYSFPVPPGTVEALRRLVREPLKRAAVKERLQESVRRVVRAHVTAHAPAAGMSGLPTPPVRRPA